MKKSLVLAMAMALGVTASAYAANPFSDVPAGHWAYDSVAKLAAAGVVDGYADGAFDGDKLMTRYEMAQIVAKAMAKGANVDKLAAEFADELDTLGVRVAKLEKGADAVKINGQVRARYVRSDADDDDGATMRNRLWISGAVNDDWTYTAMLQNTQDFSDDDGEEDTEFKRAYLEGKVGGLNVLAGRWDECTSTANILDSYVDGIKVSYGDKVKVYGMVAKAGDNDAIEGALTMDEDSRIYVLGAETKIGVIDTYVNYFKADEAWLKGADNRKWGKVLGKDDDGNTVVKDEAKGSDDRVWGDKEIYNIGLGLDLAKNVRLGYEYMWGDSEYDKRVSKDGWVARLDYKGAGEEVGSFGIHTEWFDQPINCVLSPTTDAATFLDEGGYEGYKIGFDYTLAKNILLDVNYYDTEAKAGNSEDELLYVDVYFSF
ncbi:MAG: S-layer homology domain-containing protein [Acidaminococcaceae bacterium]|nr:S-layer homology domain-containing protein [Acidaminococcaceae bacterium]